MTDHILTEPMPIKGHRIIIDDDRFVALGAIRHIDTNQAVAMVHFHNAKNTEIGLADVRLSLTEEAVIALLRLFTQDKEDDGIEPFEMNVLDWPGAVLKMQIPMPVCEGEGASAP